MLLYVFFLFFMGSYLIAVPWPCRRWRPWIATSLSLVIYNICSALLPSPAVPIIPSIYFSLCLPLALQPGILLSVKFCSSIFSLLFMGNYPIFCMFLLDVPCIMLECMCVLRRLGEFPLFSLFLWETILFFFIYSLVVSFLFL